MSEPVHFNAAISAIHPRVPKAFHGKVLCDPSGIAIKDLRGNQRAHYAWNQLTSVRLRTSDVRNPNYAGNVGSLFTFRTSWWERMTLQGGPAMGAPERMSVVKRVATLEVAAPDGVWFLRVIHKAPYQVTEALRPFVQITHEMNLND